MEREEITLTEITCAFNDVTNKLLLRLSEKGYHTIASRHEALGILEEEFHELVDAVRSGTINMVQRELLDIAVGSILAIACINSHKMDW